MNAIPSLDGLRGVAVALVFLRHAAYLAGYRDDLPPGVRAFMLNGWVGVDLFFVLSGFLISRPFIHGQPFHWRDYIARRSLRIIPAYVFVLAIVVTAPFLAVDRELLAFRVAYHLLFLQDYLGSNLLVVLWSLGVEEKFYLLAPLLLPWILRFRNASTQCCILLMLLLLGPMVRAATIAWTGPPVDYVEFFRLLRSPFHACFDGLFCGVLLARLETMQLPWVTVRGARYVFAATATLLGFSMSSHVFLDNLDVGASIFRATIIGVACALLVGSAIVGGAPAFLKSAALRYLGRISYSVYLIHVPLILPAQTISHALSGGFLAFLATYALISLAAGCLMFIFVESPFNALRATLRSCTVASDNLAGRKLPTN